MEYCMTHATSVHDFNLSLAVGCTDADLKTQLIKFFGTDELSLPNKSELVDATCDVITSVIQEARVRYAKNPQRLVGAVSTSQVANALAAWGSTKCDWIVVSEGLMQLLCGAADDMAARLTAAFPELLSSQLGRRLLAAAPLRGGFQTTLGSLLYFGAISYFAGHEAGHHLAGHDGYYLSGAHAEAEDDTSVQGDATKTTEQALERQADRLGLTITRITLTKLLGKLWEMRSFSNVEKREYQRMLAILISGGAMMAVVKIKPRDFDWADISGRTHPPAVARIITMAAELSEAFRSNFGALDDVSRRWIRVKCLELSVGATIESGTNEDRIYQERSARGGEPAAIRAVGIRKALNDPRLEQYYDELDQCLETVRPQLRPRSKEVI
jgi:hypothetical protein